METGITVDQFIAKAKKWRDETVALREIILRHDLTEELKWGKPCYSREGSNILIIQGFKDYCALMFCKGALLRDPHGLLIKPGENTQAGRQLRYTSAKEIAKAKPILKAYITEAIAAQKAGLEVKYKETADFAMPEELQNKLKNSPPFRNAFEGLTPGRQRGYILFFSGAKQAKTREARIEKCAPQILKGKGLHD